MLSQLWPEEPPGVYDSPVVQKSDLTNGLILNPYHYRYR
jgi:hypothetical protein